MINNLPSVSIIIPIYNVENYISECLDSVMSQDYQGLIECLLIDDCGTDGSMAIVKDIVANYRGQISFKTIQHRKNLGLSEARNTGIDCATEEYIFFLDSDDFIFPSCLSTLSAPLLNKKYDFVVGYNSVINREVPSPRHLKLCQGEYIASSIFNELLKGNLNVVAWNKLIKREFLLSNKLYFEKGLIHEDDLWSFQASFFATAIYVIEAPKTYVYRVRSGSIMTGTRHMMECESRAIIMRKQKLFLSQHHVGENQYLATFMERARIQLLHDISRLKAKDQLTIFRAHYKFFREKKAWSIRNPFYHLSDLFNIVRTPFPAWLLYFSLKKIARLRYK